MILVSGTKRSGTSLWMQIFGAAGYTLVGTPFPAAFGERLREANPRGFYESPLRDGIHFESNPDPETGEYLHPADVRDRVVKVFTPGLTKTDLAFIDAVIVCVRDCASYVASSERLAALDVPSVEPPLPAHLAWWEETYGAVFDALLRRYPVRFVSYERTLAEPEATIREVLDFVGGGDLARAVSTVEPGLRHHRPRAPELPAEHAAHAETFALLYDVLHERRTLDDDTLDRFSATHLALAPELAERRHALVTARLRRQLAAVDADASGAADERR